MITGLKSYADRKSSGISWLGDVPAHWEVIQLGRMGRLWKGNGGTKADEVSEGVPCIRYGDLYMHHELFISSSRSFVIRERAAEYTAVFRGDLLFAGSGETLEEIGKSAVSLIEGEACCGGDVLLFRPSREVVPRFLGYAAGCPQSVHQKSCMGRGVTVMHIYADKLKYLWMAIPPLPEQAAIVRFLDHADRRIRGAIHAKQKLIALLNEQKQAVIHRAVTRGLDPDVRLKPSGVEWFGDVPEHWRVGRVKTELRNLNFRRVPLSGPERGRMTSRQYDYYGASGVIDKVDEYLFDDELLLLAEDGANLVLRNLPLAIVARGKFWVNNHAHILKPRRGSLEYFAALLECIDYKPWITGAAQPKLTQDRLMAVRIPVPPDDEQLAIAGWVSNVTSDIDKAAARARAEIDLLREYRSCLIADVVTGKLDVRDAAARLPDEDDEPEPFDEPELSAEVDEDGGVVDLDVALEEVEA